MKVLLINRALESSSVNANKGMEAILVVTLRLLREIYPEAEFTTLMQLESSFAQHYKVKVVQVARQSLRNFTVSTLLLQMLDLFRCLLWALGHKALGLDMRFLVSNKRLKAYAQANVVIQPIADCYQDMFLPWVLQHSGDILIAKCLGKPVIFWGATVELNGWLGRRIGKFALNKVDLITLRESKSMEILAQVGVRKPYYVTADPAFCLEPASPEGRLESWSGFHTNNERPLFGLCIGDGHPLLSSPSKKRRVSLAYRTALYLRYILPQKAFQLLLRIALSSPVGRGFNQARQSHRQAVTQLIDRLIEEFDCNIVLIPHHTTTDPPLLDDMSFAKEIMRFVNNKNKVFLVLENLTAEETKWIIGQCDLFIGGKLHACINSLSQHIPTVAIPYSFKFHEIMAMLGQERLVSKGFEVEDIIARVRDAWQRKEQIRLELERRMEPVRQQVFLNAKLVKDLLVNGLTAL